MKFKRIALSLAALLICIVMCGCTENASITKSFPTSSGSNFAVNSAANSQYIANSSENKSNDDSFKINNSTNEQQAIVINEDDLKLYAEYFSKFFHEPEKYPNIEDSPNLFSFLICKTYSNLTENGKKLKNISGKDYITTVHIPLKEMESSASLLINTTSLPDKFFSDEDFKYNVEYDAFEHTPYSPPLFVTEVISIANENNIHNIVVAIKDVENQTISKPIIYSFKPISNKIGNFCFQFVKYYYQD